MNSQLTYWSGQALFLGGIIWAVAKPRKNISIVLLRVAMIVTGTILIVGTNKGWWN